jgi:hypothetical protein
MGIITNAPITALMSGECLDQPGTGSEQLVYDMPENPGFGPILLGLGLFSMAASFLLGSLPSSFC